jgi:hypothetical protein
VRNVLLLTLVLMLTASLAVAQVGRIGIFGSAAPGGVNGVNGCGVTDAAAGLLPVYVVHVGSGGATGCQFSAPLPACFTGTFLSDANVFPVTVGGSQLGAGIGYGTCQSTGVVHVMTINVFASGTTPPCCIWPVLPDNRDENNPVLAMTDCDFNLLDLPGQSGIVNPNVDCPCSDVIAVEESSWGRIKALYK